MLTKGDFLILNEERGYTHVMKVLTQEFESHRDPILAKKQHWWLRQRWPFDQAVVSLYLKNCLRLGFYEEALEQEVGWRNVSDSFLIKSMIELRQHFKRQVVFSNHVERLQSAIGVNVRPLTDFGQENYEAILDEIDKMIREDYGGMLFEIFCHVNEKGRLKNNVRKDFDLTYFSIKGNPLQRISLACSNLLREAENRVRNNMGLHKIGEGYVRETELYYKLKTQFLDLSVVHHGKPKFLGKQHFDIWFPKVKIAVEYQGLQHDQPVDFFGGQEAFKANQKRDQQKRKKCKDNGVHLIEVRPNYQFEEVICEINEVLSRR